MIYAYFVMRTYTVGATETMTTLLFLVGAFAVFFARVFFANIPLGSVLLDSIVVFPARVVVFLARIVSFVARIVVVFAWVVFDGIPPTDFASIFHVPAVFLTRRQFRCPKERRIVEAILIR